MEQKIYDIIGVGIGPFNLGLAALSSDIDSLTTIFFDKNKTFDWHGGMMLHGTRLQVPFHADLVTQVNPQSKYSFLSYLKSKGRLYRFTILEEYFPLRKEYNAYCKWVAGSLNNLHFGCYCKSIIYDYSKQYYEVEILRDNATQPEIYFTKYIVLGIGTVPFIPAGCIMQNNNVFHSSQFSYKKELLKDKDHITIIGSGQSAAEIFSDLLEDCLWQKKKLSWLTSSPRFFPMDYSKFSLELTSPDYIDHFYGLDKIVKEDLLSRQSFLYKGINCSLIDSIYNRLYTLSLEDGFKDSVLLRPNCRLIRSYEDEDRIVCDVMHKETKELFVHEADALILATGYHYQLPECISPISRLIQWDKQNRYKVNRNYSIDKHNTIFVQNAELHTHGFNAPDLGMGPYRNAIILNTILGSEYFQTERDVPFQSF